MAITRAQQAKQMLQDGGMLVQPSMTGKRPGYRGDAAARSTGAKQSGRADPGSRGDPGEGRASKGSGISESTGGFAPTKGKGASVGPSGRDDMVDPTRVKELKSIQADKRRAAARRAEINRKKGFFSFQDFVRRTKDANLASLGQVTQPFGNIRLGQINVPTLVGGIGDAVYVNPDTDFFDEDSIREIASTLTTTQGSLTKGQAKDLRDLRQDIDFQDRLNRGEDIPFEERQAYINRNKINFPDNDGPDPILPIIPKVIDDPEEEDATPDRNLAGLSSRIGGSIFDFTGMADGGRIGAAEGGIMDLARQEMFLGGIAKGIKKAVKGVSRTIKKVAKSPIGKAAILGAVGFGLGGGFSGGFKLGNLPGSSFFGKGSFNPFLKKAAGDQVFSGLGSILNKAGLVNLSGGLTGSGILTGISAASLLPLLMGPKEEEDKFDIAEYYRQNALNPNAPLNMRIAGSQFAFADGGRIGYSDGMEAGAMSEKEMKKLAKSPLYKGFKKMYGIDPSMAKGNKAYDEKFDMFEKLFKKGFAEGGDVEPVAKKTMPLLDMDGQEMDLRAEGGFVPIGRMEKADDVPARLSKNEFVFTADAVRNAGDGNVDKGAEVMYNMMKNLESGGDVSEESQGLSGAREMFQTSKRLEEVL
jgi:hypothetical protein